MDSQNIIISDRNMVSISNVINVISFNEHEFLLQTPFGKLKVLGKNLAILKMDTNKKELVIKGNIDSISYLSDSKSNKSEKKESVFAKLMKPRASIAAIAKKIARPRPSLPLKAWVIYLTGPPSTVPSSFTVLVF